jgi:hypothetical protein
MILMKMEVTVECMQSSKYSLMYTDFRSLGLLQPKFLTIGLTSWLILFPISIAYATFDAR